MSLPNPPPPVKQGDPPDAVGGIPIDLTVLTEAERAAGYPGYAVPTAPTIDEQLFRLWDHERLYAHAPDESAEPAGGAR